MEEIITPNPFPINAFPEGIQNIINATNECLKFPIDYIGASILSAASIAIGNSCMAEVMSGWKENCVLYMALVGPPNINKSHPLSFSFKPLFDFDNTSYYKYEKAKSDFESETVANDSIKPEWCKCIITDFTQEALALVHRINKRGIGVYSDELPAWINSFNRYRKGNDQQFWLSNFNSKPITIDRKSSEPIRIPFPFISVAGTIQTGILPLLAEGNRNNDGFIYRLLYAFPEGLTKPYWSENDIDPVIIANWDEIISILLDIELNFDGFHNPNPEVLKFSAEAKELLWQWQRDNTDLCNTTDDDSLKGFYGKYDFYAVRFALILELLGYACSGIKYHSIGIESVKGALMLVKYFQYTAGKVNSIISKPLDSLPENKKKLYNALPTIFTREEGLIISENMGIPRPTFDRFLTDGSLFRKLKTGNYEKVLQ